MTALAFGCTVDTETNAKIAALLAEDDGTENIPQPAEMIPENKKNVLTHTLNYAKVTKGFLEAMAQLLQNIQDGEFVYFVHSYFAAECDDSVAATTEYGIPMTAAVESENIFGCQFHPEKSGDVGLRILKTFCEL